MQHTIYLHIYHINKLTEILSYLSIHMYHTSISVYGYYYSFGSDNEISISHTPVDLKLVESIQVGYFFSDDPQTDIINVCDAYHLKYHLINNNCNNFCQFVIHQLGCDDCAFPQYVTRCQSCLYDYLCIYNRHK